MAKAQAKTTAKTASASKEVAPRGREIEMVGEVVSDKMDKTITVQIYRLVRHKKYGKFMRRSSSFKAHDEKGEAKTGDIVRIVHTRPLSKTKRWKLKEIVKQSRATADVKEVNA